MPRYIIHHDGYFFMWTTVTDAPYTIGGTRKEFTEWYREEFGRSAMSDLDERLDRAIRNGSSKLPGPVSAQEATDTNRAGHKGSWLTFEQIIQIYCKEGREPVKGEGTRAPYEDEEDEVGIEPGVV